MADRIKVPFTGYGGYFRLGECNFEGVRRVRVLHLIEGVMPEMSDWIAEHDVDIRFTFETNIHGMQKYASFSNEAHAIYFKIAFPDMF